MEAGTDKILIRRAVEADVDALAALYRDTILTINSRHYNPEQVAAWAHTASRTDSLMRRMHTQYFLVAEIDGRIAGFGSITTDGSYLDFLYVHKDFQRMGIARTLYIALEDYARRRPAFFIHAEVSITARPFFESQGFLVLKEQQEHIDGVALTNFRMRKTL